MRSSKQKAQSALNGAKSKGRPPAAPPGKRARYFKSCQCWQRCNEDEAQGMVFASSFASAKQSMKMGLYKFVGKD